MAVRYGFHFLLSFSVNNRCLTAQIIIAVMNRRRKIEA